MKLTKEHIGQKFRLRQMSDGYYFIPLAFTSTGIVIGENASGECQDWYPDDEWIPYEEPKQELLMSPGLHIQGDTCYWSDVEFSKTKPLRVVFKNRVHICEDGSKFRMSDIEADLWIKIEGEGK